MRVRMVSGNLSQTSSCQSVHKQFSGDISLHWHDVYEFDIILGGTGETVCNSVRTPLRRGLITLLTPKDYHEYQNCRDVQLINIQFREDGIGYDTLNSFLIQQTHTIYADEATLEKIQQLSALLSEPSAGTFHTAYQQKLLECMILIFLDCRSKGELNFAATTPIQNAVIYINNHFRENPKMTDVASMFFFCDNYFCRLFKMTTGKSYKTYLRDLKLEYSTSLLLSTTLSITEIAEHCGYATPSHFNREFKKQYGMSPTHFRAQLNH